MAEKKVITDPTLTEGAPLVVEENPALEKVTIEEFLKGAEGSETLKGMFVHFTSKLEGPDVKATKEAFQDLFNAFKELPADQL